MNRVLIIRFGREISRLLGDEPYLAGTMPSLADMMLAPQFHLFAQTPEWQDLTAEGPNLASWPQRAEARPSLAKAMRC